MMGFQKESPLQLGHFQVLWFGFGGVCQGSLKMDQITKIVIGKMMED